jgi:hypothetical protein
MVNQIMQTAVGGVRAPGAEALSENVIAIALRGLPQMVDPASSFFSHTCERVGGRMTPKGVSHRYTTMVLLGLRRAEQAGHRSPVDVREMLERLTANLDWITNIGDLGLMLWTIAELDTARLPKFCEVAGIARSLERFGGNTECFTMETAWFLTGLAAARQAAGSELKDLDPVAHAVYAQLTGNQGKSELSGHLHKGRTVAAHARRHIGSFADQVYPTIAFSRYAQAYQRQESAQRALRCARRICELQGEYGQWWWHYDSRTGDVIEPYPVYSVHQHGMAPMALFAAGDATGENFSAGIVRGLEWITGANEIHRDMRDPEAGVVWRCAYAPKLKSYLNAAAQTIRLPLRLQERPETLKIRYECRPYELGWALYGLAGRQVV